MLKADLNFTGTIEQVLTAAFKKPKVNGCRKK